MIGKRYGALVALEKADKQSGHQRWLMQCDCGNQVTVRGSDLNRGRTKSCGCQKKSDDLMGQRFGKLTVLGYFMETKWWCKCDCGCHTIPTRMRLKEERSTSCGVCGDDARSAHQLYGTWASMKDRCNNPDSASYHHYGGRGITICKRWSDFWNFVDDMGERPDGCTIDRINNDGDYEPENCHWATQKQQTRNTRVNINYSYQGRTQCVSAWAEELGFSVSSMSRRLLNWDIERAMTQPKRAI